MNYTDKQIEELLEGIYLGVINIYNLPKDLYLATSEKLLSAFNEIEGKPSKELIEALDNNVQFFSGAKTYQQINDLSIISKSKEIKTFKDFREEALKVYEQYNVNWLETEYQTTIGQSQTAVRWEQIQDQKKFLPYLKYDAVIDTQTSEICRPLDGVTLRADDKFWNTNSPLNHFNCRCVLIQLEKEEATETTKEKADEISKQLSEERQPLFNSNSGITKQIFTKEHPYFDIPKKDIDYAKRNFDLPLNDGK